MYVEQLTIEYYKIFRARGKDIAGILRAGLPLLESLTLLFHEAGGSHWISFIPRNRAKPHIRWYVGERGVLS